ncbi:MAG: CsiV family protein, partial [Woeseia sp.]
MKPDLDFTVQRGKRKHPSRCFSRAATAALLAMAAASVANAQGQREPEAPEEATPRYAVELIVFTYHASGSAGSEVFVPDKPALAPRADELPQEEILDPAANDPGRHRRDYPQVTQPLMPALPQLEEGLRQLPTGESVRLQLLNSDDYKLARIYEKLARLDAYEPVMHAAWTQGTPPKNLAPPIRLRALGTPPLGLDGTVTVYRGRFVHLSLDLALDAEAPQQAGNATDRLIYSDGRVGSEGTVGGFDDSRPPPVRYRIVEDRIMRSGETRYFDHPRFGVLARLTVMGD